MNWPTIAAGLPASLDRAEKLRALRDGLGSGPPPTEHLYALVAAVAVLLALVVLLSLVSRRRRGGTRPGHADLLAHGAALAGLDRGELRDLRAIAARCNLSHPAAMLLSPANLAHAARHAEDDPHLAQRLKELSVKLFGTSLPDE